MHTHTLDKWKHSHDFVIIHEKGEKRTKQVLVLTVITMVVEIIAGISIGTMWLLIHYKVKVGKKVELSSNTR